MQSKFTITTFALAAAALCASSTAGAVARVPATAIAVAANCAAAVGAAGAAVAQAPVRPACLLPVVDRVATAPMVEPGPVITERAGGFGYLPLFALAAIIAGIGVLVGIDNNDNDRDLSRG